MRQIPAFLGMIGLATLGIAASVGVASAQGHGACRQITSACQDAGFVQGAARDGVGLYMHCVAPIVQGSAQPSSARRPLPKVDAQLAADCKASRSLFGRLRPPSSEAAAQPPAEGTASPRLAYGYPPGQDRILRPPMPMTSERRAAIAALPPEDQPETGPAKSLPPQLRRTTVDYRSNEPAGTIVIDTPSTYLYLILGNGKAMRYGIGVGREGFTWSGAEKITRMAEWPDWHPPEQMIERQPYLPRFMAGGEGNPLGARALYLGQTLYRIHGTNQPSTIGTFVSSGCIRLTNEDITDLYGRVKVGTRVVVLPGKAPNSVQATPNARPTESAPRPRPKAAAAEKPATAPAVSAASPSAPQTPAPAAKGQVGSNDVTSTISAGPATPAAPHVGEE
jgi:lipoprotein-anchoring transpeptidase ErfK/SrfK